MVVVVVVVEQPHVADAVALADQQQPVSLVGPSMWTSERRAAFVFGWLLSCRWRCVDADACILVAVDVGSVVVHLIAAVVCFVQSANVATAAAAAAELVQQQWLSERRIAERLPIVTVAFGGSL